ncbi:hypothetical protein [Bradyrhizobium sp.]|jgi:hypothetical protein|uniref:hypothetical protein n=1 Tax=Bradyrhizobium sp. TaxID=376 RepID=UPI002DDD9D17|nr:hypothetical protein [Bradyrhizobium sp.]HEV2160393.1 hypothetical protein [Bradyrhizobium sp.]
MKHAGIEIRIGRLVVDASRRAEVAGLSDAIGQALQHRLAGAADQAGAAPGDAPRMVADSIATRLTTTPGAGRSRGRP